LHCVWQFKEAIDTQVELGRLEDCLRRLADVVGGDLAVAHPAALLRLPGTHNSKNGEWREVINSSWVESRTYELDDIEEWLDEQSPVIRRKTPNGAPPNGANYPENLNPYLDFANRSGLKPPIDVAQRLEAMTYQGPNETCIHKTQVRVTASLVKRGLEFPAVIEIVLAATQKAVGQQGANWNWIREERALLKMCESAHKKFVESQELRTKTMDAIPLGEMRNGEERKEFVQGNIVNMQQAKTKRETKIKDVAQQTKKKFKLVSESLKAVLANTLLFDDDHTAWYYDRGLWKYADNFKDWIDIKIQICANDLGIVCDNKLCSEVRGDISRDPDFQRNNVPWDRHGQVPTLSGLVHPETLELTLAKPEHYCTWRLACIFNPSAVCPNWKDMLSDCFADMEENERDLTIQCLQELLGVGLVNDKPRGLRRALILYGGKNCGKSSILEVFAGLFGDVISVEIDSIKNHGLMPFRKRLPWILHEAFDQSTWHQSAIVKTLITGETFSVNIKNGPIIANQQWHGSIYWATNHPPQFKENTDAMVSRIVPIHCRTKFEDEAPSGVALAAIESGFSKPSELIVETELPGVLLWALEGMKRAVARGRIATSAATKGEKETIWRESNLVARFIEDCTEYSPDHRITVPDFCLAVSVWFGENKGESRGYMPSNDAIKRAVTALHNECIQRERENSMRWYVGLRLNDAGLKYFDTGRQALAYEAKRVVVSLGDANRIIPAHWSDRIGVTKMRKKIASLFASQAKNDSSREG